MKAASAAVLVILLAGTAVWAGSKTTITGIAPLTLGAKKADVLRAVPALVDVSKERPTEKGIEVFSGGSILVPSVDPKRPAVIDWVDFRDGRLDGVSLTWASVSKAIYTALRAAVLAAYDRSLVTADIMTDDAVSGWSAVLDLKDKSGTELMIMGSEGMGTTFTYEVAGPKPVTGGGL